MDFVPHLLHWKQNHTNDKILLIKLSYHSCHFVIMWSACSADSWNLVIVSPSRWQHVHDHQNLQHPEETLRHLGKKEHFKIIISHLQLWLWVHFNTGCSLIHRFTRNCQAQTYLQALLTCHVFWVKIHIFT